MEGPESKPQEEEEDLDCKPEIDGLSFKPLKEDSAINSQVEDCKPNLQNQEHPESEEEGPKLDSQMKTKPTQDKTNNKWKFQCDFCTRSFKRKDRLDTHLKVHTGDRPYICGVPGCYSSYTRLQHLQRHIERVHFGHNTVEAKLECPSCDALLANPECLKRHIQRFHSGPPQGKVFKCPEEGCNVVFRKKSQLITHREQDHAFSSPNAARCHKCPYEGCGKSFPFPTVLRRHMKVHQGYDCDIEGCGEVFETYIKLRKHKAVDHGPDLVCRQCQAEFKTRQTLVQHLKTHLFVKEVFGCTETGCDRTFLYKKNLKQHIRAYHLGERVFTRKKVPKDLSQKTPKPRLGPKKSSAGLICGVNDGGKAKKPETPLDLSVPCNDEQAQNPSCSFDDILQKFYPPSNSESSSDTDMDSVSELHQTVNSIMAKEEKLSNSIAEAEVHNHHLSECDNVKCDQEKDKNVSGNCSPMLRQGDNFSGDFSNNQEIDNLLESFPTTSRQDKESLSSDVLSKQEKDNLSAYFPNVYNQVKDNLSEGVLDTQEKDYLSRWFPTMFRQEKNCLTKCVPTTEMQEKDDLSGSFPTTFRQERDSLSGIALENDKNNKDYLS